MLKFLIQQIYGLSNRTIFYQYYTVHAYVFIHFCGSRWSFFGWKEICADFLSFVYICTFVLQFQLSEGESWNPIK